MFLSLASLLRCDCESFSSPEPLGLICNEPVKRRALGTRMTVSVFPFANPGAFHLVKISRNFGSAVNGKRFVGSFLWKIPRKSGKSKKVGPFSRLERSERNFTFHLHVSRSLYQFKVHGKKIYHGQFAKQNGFPWTFTHQPVHSLFFCCPLRMTTGTLGKLCIEVAAPGNIPQGNRFGRPPILVQCQVLAFV